MPVFWFHSKNFKLDQMVQKEHCEVQEGGNENSNLTKGYIFVVLEEVLIIFFSVVEAGFTILSSDLKCLKEATFLWQC